MKLEPEEREILEKGKLFGGRFKVLGNIKKICGGNHREVLKSMEDKDLIERVDYGVFELTDTAFSKVVGAVSCELCGANFDSVLEANSVEFATIKCNHPKLSFQLKEYLRE